MPDPRLLLEERLSAGAELALNEGQARHVGTVLRLEVGAALRVFNARDGEWRASVAEKTKRGMRVRVEALLRAAHAAPDLELLFAPVKRQATDLIVEKATELGVARIRPVITQRTIAETVRIDRLNAIAREAAEQSERFDAPEIFAPVSLGKALDGWDAARPLIYCDEQGEAASLLDALQNKPFPLEGGGAGVGVKPHPALRAEAPHPHTPSPSGGGGAPALALLIGPEGGFTREEQAMLRGRAFVIAVSLGPRILRAETAAIAALTIVQAVWGDWR